MVILASKVATSALYVSLYFNTCDAPITHTFPLRSGFDSLSISILKGIYLSVFSHIFLRQVCHTDNDNEDLEVDSVTVDLLLLVRSNTNLPLWLSLLIIIGIMEIIVMILISISFIAPFFFDTRNLNVVGNQIILKFVCLSSPSTKPVLLRWHLVGRVSITVRNLKLNNIWWNWPIIVRMRYLQIDYHEDFADSISSKLS